MRKALDEVGGKALEGLGFEDEAPEEDSALLLLRRCAVRHIYDHRIRKVARKRKTWVRYRSGHASEPA